MSTKGYTRRRVHRASARNRARPMGRDDRFLLMGTFSVEVSIRRPRAGSDAWTPVKCLVDTGAGFCQFPTVLLAGLRITPDREVPVVLADGRTRSQPAAWLGI